jgi:hypothetical protein
MGSEPPGAKDEGRPLPARRAARYVSALKIPVALFCIFGVGIAGYYFIYVKQRTQYVAGRNFRVLATVGDQLQASITGARTAIRSFLNDPEVFNKVKLPDQNLTPCQNPQPYFRKIAPDYVPILRSIQIGGWSCESNARPLLRLVEGTQATWVIKQRAVGADQVSVPVSLNLADVVTPSCPARRFRICSRRWRSRPPPGRVIAQTGDSHLRVADFGQLPLRIAGSKETTKFASISGSPIVAEVELAGSAYVLFVPALLHEHDRRGRQAAAGDKAAEPAVCGGDKRLGVRVGLERAGSKGRDTARRAGVPDGRRARVVDRAPPGGIWLALSEARADRGARTCPDLRRPARRRVQPAGSVLADTRHAGPLCVPEADRPRSTTN